MKKYLIYIFGLLLILIGLVLKITLGHNIEFWRFVKSTSIILFAFGFTVLLPFDFNKGFQKKEFVSSPLKWLIRNVKQIVFIVIVFSGIIGFEKLGVNLNYKLREFYLSHDTAKTIGSIKGIKRIDIVRLGREDFYVVNFLVGKEIKSYGLITKYAKLDNNYFDNFVKPNINQGNMTINRLKGSEVEVLYSKKFPSFYRIVE